MLRIVSYCLHESLESIVIKEKEQTCCTFVHPYTRGDNNTMGTSIKQSVGQIAVLLENMRQKGLEFGKFEFSQMFNCRRHRPVEVPTQAFLHLPMISHPFSLLNFVNTF